MKFYILVIFVAHLFGGATHVDVNDLCTAIHVVQRSVCHHLRLGAGNLHRNGARLAFMVGAARSLQRVPQIRARGHHFAHRVARTQAFAQLAKRAIRHARHGSNKQGIRQSEMADVHAKFLLEVRWECGNRDAGRTSF